MCTMRDLVEQWMRGGIANVIILALHVIFIGIAKSIENNLEVWTEIVHTNSDIDVVSVI